MQHFSSQAVLSRYRLIDSGCEPHRQLDGQYASLDEAIADAIVWLEPLAEPNNASHVIGLDVATADGNWRTCRLPAPLLCVLPTWSTPAHGFAGNTGSDGRRLR